MASGCSCNRSGRARLAASNSTACLGHLLVGRGLLCLCRSQTLLCQPRAIQHCQQPLAALLRALCLAHPAQRVPRAAWRNGVLAGLFLVFQAWAELTYATFLLLFFALAYLYFSLTWLLATPRQVARWWRSTQGMVAAALVFAIGISPFLIALLPDLRMEGDFFASGGGFADIYSADLMGYLMPTRLHPLSRRMGGKVALFQRQSPAYLPRLYAAALASRWHHGRGCVIAAERATTGFWLLAFVAFWLLTLGPFVRWAGADSPIPGPFTLVSQLPFFNGNRYPSRYSVMLLLCAALLACRGLLWLTTQSWLRGRKRQTFATFTVVGLLFAAEHISTPLPLSDFRIPSVYQRLAAETGDFTVLELPTGWRNGARVLGKSDVLIMMQQWYQTAHGKRRLGGNTSRNPAYKFQYFSETPLLADLIALMNADRSHLEPCLGRSNIPPLRTACARRSARPLRPAWCPLCHPAH